MKFPLQASLAISQNSIELVKIIFEKYQQSMKSSTIRVLSKQGIFVCGELFPDSVALLVGFRGSCPIILKKLNPTELVGFKLIFSKKSKLSSAFLVPVDVFQASSPVHSPAKPWSDGSVSASAATPETPLSRTNESIGPAQGRALFRTPVAKIPVLSESDVTPCRIRHEIRATLFPCADQAPAEPLGQLYSWACMPRFVCSVDLYPVAAEVRVAEQLLFQIHDALDCLHKAGLAHSDVKPANIFVHTSGDFYLGDFGGVREIGTPISETTAAFVPTASTEQVDSHRMASASYDLWMLAMTVYDMLSHPDNRAGLGARFPPSQKFVRDKLLNAGFSAAGRQLVKSITQSAATDETADPQVLDDFGSTTTGH